MKVIASETIATRSHLGPDAVVRNITEVVQQMSDHHSVKLQAVGIGVPGLVDIAAGVTKFLPNLPTQWRDIPLAEMVTSKIGCPTRILNDARTATLAELRLGHGRDFPGVTMAFFSLGTGVGGGISIDGKLQLGRFGSAGEIGHQTILAEGPRCGCGNRGCLETLASGPAIAAEGVRLMRMGLAPTLYQLTGGNADRVTAREMKLAADQDPRIHEALLRAATYIGIAAANVVAVIHPHLVVLGGGVSEIGELLNTTVLEVIRDRVRMYPVDDIRVERSLLGDQAGVMGAIALAVDAISPSNPIS